MTLTAGHVTADNNLSMDAELEIGAEYDSRLNVEELDRSTSTSDAATVIKAKLNGGWKTSDNLKFKAGMSHLGKHYRDQTAFDIAINQLFVDGSYDFDAVTLGGSHYFAAAQLDDEDLLDLNLSSLYLSRLFANQYFVRLAGNHTEKEFDGRPERDANNSGVDGDFYYFFNSSRSFVSFGVSYNDEDAKAPELDYDGLTIKSKLQNKFSALGKPSKVALSYHYVDRDYAGFTPQIGSSRRDRRQTSKLEWEMEMLPHLDLVSGIEYRDYDSNLSSVNYAETLASLALRVKL